MTLKSDILSGNVTAEYIWANYATYRDFEDLSKNGVNITGKVVLCRYGKVFRGLKVKRAQDLGAIGRPHMCVESTALTWTRCPHLLGSRRRRLVPFLDDATTISNGL
jgi:hypothetical protein